MFSHTLTYILFEFVYRFMESDIENSQGKTRIHIS